MKTAVDQLIEKMSLEDVCKYSNELAEAKEMEKQQIMDSHNQGYADGYRDNGTSPIEYYNETYKKEIKMKK